MIQVKRRVFIDEREIEESFVRASGPGGQNVNKLSTAVELRFDVRQSPSLPGPVRARLERSEEHTSELQSLMRISYAVFCLQKKKAQVGSLTKTYHIKPQ